MSRNKSKKGKLGKGKKALIIAGCAAAGEVLVGVAATVAAPLTGGATAPLAAAMYSLAAKDVAIVGAGAAGGAAVGVVATKIVDSKRESNAYSKGYNDASKTYEAKFTEQAAKFAEQADEWERVKQTWEGNQAEKDKLLKECLKYIKDLELELKYLKKKNMTLSKEKQELLEKLYKIRDGFNIT